MLVADEVFRVDEGADERVDWIGRRGRGVDYVREA